MLTRSAAYTDERALMTAWLKRFGGILAEVDATETVDEVERPRHCVWVFCSLSLSLSLSLSPVSLFLSSVSLSLSLSLSVYGCPVRLFLCPLSLLSLSLLSLSLSLSVYGCPARLFMCLCVPLSHKTTRKGDRAYGCSVRLSFSLSQYAYFCTSKASKLSASLHVPGGIVDQRSSGEAIRGSTKGELSTPLHLYEALSY